MQQRNTLQRELVLQAVHRLKNHPTAEDIYHEVAAGHPQVSRGTVYRNLSLLAQQGAIQRVSHLNAADRFDFNLQPHYHFRCTACGAVSDVDTPYDDSLLARPGGAGGYLYQSCEVVYTGLCPHCQKL